MNRVASHLAKVLPGLGGLPGNQIPPDAPAEEDLRE